MYEIEGVVSIGGGDGAGGSLQGESGMDWRLGNMRFRGMERGLPGGIVWGESVPRLSVDFGGKKSGCERRVGANRVVLVRRRQRGANGRCERTKKIVSLTWVPKEKKRGKDGEGPLDVK